MTRQSNPLSIEYILLGLLADNPRHGYDLFKQITHFDAISLVWNIKQSQLYALLDKLESDGLLKSTMVAGDSHLMKKIFNLTGAGIQTFTAWKTSPVDHLREMRQEFLAKLYFCQKNGGEAGFELIEEQRGLCFEWLTSQQMDYAAAREDQYFERMVYQFRINQTQAILEWLIYCEIELQNQVASLLRDNEKDGG
ncbi:MAG: PadR family transcriptional regulator [Anaerolineaceae bacterium]